MPTMKKNIVKKPSGIPNFFSDVRFFLLLLLLAIVVAYWGLWDTFYQQDEWIAVGYAMGNGWDFFYRHHWFQILAGTGRILSSIISVTIFSVFPFEIWPFSVFALVFHFANSVLVYLISYKFTKSHFISGIAGLFFSVSSIGDQAILWAGAATNVLPSTFLIFLSIFTYGEYMEQRKKYLLLLSFTSAVTAYYFRENSLFLFVFLPVLYFLWERKIEVKKRILHAVRLHAPLLGFLTVILVLRILDLQSRYYVGHFVTNSEFVKEKLALHMILYPLSSLSQMFVHSMQMFSWANLFERIYYPYLSATVPSPAVYEFVITDMFSFVLSLLLLFTLFHLYRHYKQHRIPVLFSLSFIFLSLLPYAMLEKPNAYLESRYYYTSILGGGLLFGILLQGGRAYLVRISGKQSIAAFIVLVFALLYFFQQYLWIRKDLDLQIMLGKQRKDFLTSLQLLYPNLHDKTVFYFTGSQDYYIPGNKIPFQLGPGYTFMTWYFDSGKIPEKFIREEFLSDLASQGYIEEQGAGFGYYRDFDKLLQDVGEYNIAKSDIVSFYYDGTKKKLVDISVEVRREIEASESAVSDK